MPGIRVHSDGALFSIPMKDMGGGEREGWSRRGRGERARKKERERSWRKKEGRRGDGRRKGKGRERERHRRGVEGTRLYKKMPTYPGQGTGILDLDQGKL